VPAAVVPPAEYQRALDRGWRSEDGSPGHSYWQQWAGYQIDAELDPESSRLTGSVQILYHHDAPANLQSVFVHLHQNLHKAGSPRYESQEITDGVTITSLSADGEDLIEGEISDGPGWEVDGTILQVRPTIRLERGDTLQLDIGWEVELPQRGAGRMGHSDNEVFFVAYWYPKMAIFDNLRGWNAQPYLGNAEFYDDFGDYEVNLTVPTGWTLMATGELENPNEVFSAVTVNRLEAAATADTLVTIASRASRDAGSVTADGVDGKLTYRFRAENVRDFAFTASNVQRWDATSALVPESVSMVADEDDSDDTEGENGDAENGEGGEMETAAMPSGPRRVLIHSFWREDRAPLWAQQWEFAKQSIEFHSEYTGMSYPWPHMTSVEGADIIEGGMEFPMMTVMGSYEGQEATDLFNVTSHEIGHMWIPLIVSTDEKRHAWLDEGTTTYLEHESRMDLWPGVDHHRVEGRYYLQAAAAGAEQSMMRHGDYYEPGPGYGVASYAKPAALLRSLRAVIGEETFDEALATFLHEWAYKHPSPWDFFNTFERFAEEDLDWFWSSFYYNTWTLDHAVASVAPQTGGGAIVTIEDRSSAIFPATVRIRTANGMDFVHQIPVEHWLAGNATYEIDIAATAGQVRRVEIDPDGFSPDVDRSNNLWPQGR
ncbi:MAG: M1 family metallopeptidase, partial [Gemmatimonadota bacterium]